MITMEDSIMIAYRSSAVACAAAKAKAEWVADALIREREKKKTLEGDRERLAFYRNQRRIVLWTNYRTAQSYAYKFFTYGSGAPDSIGVRWRLERLWTMLGNDIADLPNWDEIEQKKPKTVVSFTEDVDWVKVEQAQKAFDSNMHELSTKNFSRQFEIAFDLFVNDIWASEGMRRWTLQNGDITGYSTETVQEWHSIQDGAGQFFDGAQNCCVKMRVQFHQYLNHEEAVEDVYREQYRYQPETEYRAVRGLWAIEASDLPQDIQIHMENPRVTIR